ncbi:hypothetical protein BC827DRAFT_1206197 [Russula dissimulans]|nr:hypothetical protein BC827DRAFT_1206197 [Russula dissimulans]
MLKKDDKSQQVVYYQAGIGTYTIPEIATPLMARISKTMDMAIGNHLDAHVMDHAEDKICIFGFSRGAYTARALAGMIYKVGLLPAGNHQQVPFAYKMFTRDDDEGWKQSTAFKKAFSVDVEIEFVGVWDTVSSVGLVPRTLPFTSSNTAIRYFRHAISLDEHRAKFTANYYHLTPPEDLRGTKPGEMPRSNHRHPHFHRHHHDHHHKGKSPGEKQYERDDVKTDVLEVWFAGCHCDIGGGSVANGTRNSLARIPLRWMIRQCFLVDTGIQFHRDAFKDVGLDPSSLFPFVLPRPAPLKPTRSEVARIKSFHSAEPTDGTLVASVQASPTAASTFRTEEDEELVDSLAWWVLEVLPLRKKGAAQKHTPWKKSFRVNLGRPRQIPRDVREKKATMYVHRSVRTRMEAEDLKGGKYWVD